MDYLMFQLSTMLTKWSKLNLPIFAKMKPARKYNVSLRMPLIILLELSNLSLLEKRNARLRLNLKLKPKLILGYCTLAIMDILDIMVMDMDLDMDGADIMDLGTTEDAATT